MNDPVLTTKEAAEKLRLHEETIRRWLKRGKLKGYMFADSSGWRVYASSIDELIRQSEPTTTGETTATDTKK